MPPWFSCPNHDANGSAWPADLHSQAFSGHFSLELVNVFASKKEEPDSCARGCQIAKKIATSEHQIAKKMVNSEGICSPFACEGGVY